MGRSQPTVSHDVDAAVDFYSKLFATPVNKRKPGYANFEIADPPLKLVLIEAAEGGTLNHLGHRPRRRPMGVVRQDRRRRADGQQHRRFRRRRLLRTSGRTGQRGNGNRH